MIFLELFPKQHDVYVKAQEYIESFKQNSLIVDGHFDLLMDVATQREKGR